MIDDVVATGYSIERHVVDGYNTLGGVRVHDGSMRPGVYVRIVGGKAKKIVVK